MSLIKIIANDIEIDIVKETLNITKENNSFVNDYKVYRSDFPFLIVENSKAIKALGARGIDSVNKPKIVSVIVFELNERYHGELQILSYLNGFRKVTLKYASELLTIMNTQISSFMPVVSVIPGEQNPVPFTEESEINYDQSMNWKNYPIPFLSKNFPEVKWQFPTMYWKNKFGVNLGTDDPWALYKNYINQYENDELIVNTIVYDNGFVIKNKNVVSPQVYLLAPLFYALKSIGFTAEGLAFNNPFLQRILFLSTKNNLSNTKSYKLTMPPLIPLTVGSTAYESSLQILIERAGTYTINYSINEISFPNEPNREVLFKVFFLSIRGYYQHNTTLPSQVLSGSIDVDVDESHIGMFIEITYFTRANFIPEYKISVDNEDNSYYQMHPTIELGRYVPEWTFGTYLNELKNIFNLKIEIDDLRKKVSLNFNEDIIETPAKEVLKKSLKIQSHDQPFYDSFHLKFGNDEDSSLYIYKTGDELYLNQKSDFPQLIESKFKFVPNNSFTAELSENLESKDGVGFMIYSSENSPYISNNYQNQTLKIEGENGIYENYWKKWLKFRLNASHIEMTGFFNKTELSRIQKKQRIYIDKQDYMVTSVEYSETKQSNFEVLLKLESVSF